MYMYRKTVRMNWAIERLKSDKQARDVRVLCIDSFTVFGIPLGIH